MERGIWVIGVAWMLVLGTFDASGNDNWDTYAISIPDLAPSNHFELIGGWTW